ncbi:MAG: response regulator transcription factor [Alistipes sp.]|nr:response regulator transcription factor [Alistipes sp.]
MIRCITIDDEPLALKQIKNYIKRIPFLSLEAEFNNASEARRFLETESVELLFVDINMPDISGVEFVRDLDDERRPMIIFTTAYSEYAIEGFKLDAVDYLLKPFSFDEFSRAVNKANSLYELYCSSLQAQDSAGVISEAEVADENAGGNEYISIKADYKVSLVRLADIVYIESDSEYVRLHFTDGSSIMTLFRMKKMAVALPSDMFMRVHRSFIVNLKCVTGYARGRVYLNNNEYVPIGENYKEQFISYVSKNYPTL